MSPSSFCTDHLMLDICCLSSKEPLFSETHTYLKLLLTTNQAYRSVSHIVVVRLSSACEIAQDVVKAINVTTKRQSIRMSAAPE